VNNRLNGHEFASCVGLLVARLNLPSDTGILIGSFEILCHEDGTTVIDFRLLLAFLSQQQNLGVEAVPPNNPAAKVQYQTSTTLKPYLAALGGIAAPSRS
jgi:hypothetical protein